MVGLPDFVKLNDFPVVRTVPFAEVAELIRHLWVVLDKLDKVQGGQIPLGVVFGLVGGVGYMLVGILGG